MMKAVGFVKERQSNFEILRIIAMFCIVLGHSMTHGTLLNSSSDFSGINFFIFRFFAYSGKIGVYLFVLITGYFMIYSNISIKKVVKLWLPVVFWSVFLTIFIGIFINQLSYKEVVMSFLPIVFNRYWFVSTYIFLYLLIPFINKSLLNLNIRQEILICVLGFFIIVPSNYLYGNNLNSWLMSFCFTYSIGAIIRKRELLKRKKTRIFRRVFLGLGLIGNSINSIIITYARNSTPVLNKLSIFLQKETVFCLFVALSLFIIFGTVTIPYNRLINTIASATFGIYLIHDNSKMEYLLWIKIFRMNQLSSSLLISIFYVLFCTITIFMVCSMLELIRRKIFGKIENKAVTFVETSVKKYINRFCEKGE
ncbi:acyltransferase family protein [Streptococcus equinus]|uniref:acyltransferase family protein n=1 Tax=Streptococcus equinus TaxID=1335 RepID=UPI00237C018F|nr:acyltransferase [Streptococcus equinus]